MYTVKKTFVGGILEGISIHERTTVRFEVGKQYDDCVGVCTYRVDECRTICDSCGEPSDDLRRREQARERAPPSTCWMAPVDECPRCREEAACSK